MKELLTQLCDLLKNNTPLVLVSVVEHQGSTPRGGGSKMLVTDQGLYAGSIGGGLAEGLCLEQCAQVLASKQAHMKHFDLTGHMAAQSEMICGGALDVLLCPLSGEKDLAFYETLLQHLNEHTVYALQCVDDNGKVSRALQVNGEWLSGIWDTGTLNKNAKDDLLHKLPQGEESKYLQAESCVIEKYTSPWNMLILGGGHISRPTATIAHLTGFEVNVMDDRAEFSQKERFPSAHNTYTVPEFENCFDLCPPTSNTCLIIVTRGHVHDKSVLQQALATKASYIGMIGSKRKKQEVYNALLAEGISQEQLDKVKCPIGISINAQTPEEIAVSIVAECIEHKRKSILNK